ncbi:MAG: 2Fe-2S iron-sulfur cluster binding domain-containing protein [Proteobacteria bacterium]|nr:2Fe-2S iron-sulfur cluster binding domain-containing protein [Pseudomonadota bacterium]
MLKFHSLRIADLQPDADDAVAIALEVPQELRSEYVGLPGQHVVLRTELEGSEARRTYSLTNVPGEWPLRIVARVHEHGRMSRHLSAKAKVGDRIDVLPPNGSLTPRSAEQAGAQRTYVGFASGCGITPVLSIVKATLQANPANRFILFYGNSSTERVMCLEELLGLKDRYIHRLALHFVMSREPQEVDVYNGRIDAARVRDLARTLFKPDQVAEFFVCGPGDMIEQVSGALRELNVPADRVHSEHFRDEGVGQGGASAAGSAGGTKATAESGIARVTVLMDGRHRTFNMKIDGETVLDAATDAGLELPFSCRAGVCSTCRTKVVSGEVAMDQNYALEDWELEQGYVLACQSRCKTPTLELDYDEK